MSRQDGIAVNYTQREKLFLYTNVTIGCINVLQLFNYYCTTPI